MKYFLLTILALLPMVCLPAVSATEYLIGAYTSYVLRLAEPPEQVMSELAEMLLSGGFNAAKYSMYDDEIATGKLQIALDEMNKRGIATILDDGSMPAIGPVGVLSLANGNHLKLEAEYILNYQDGTFVPDILPWEDPSDDKFNYVFRHDTGRRSGYDPEKYSNGYAWVCDEAERHSSGLALTEPRFRWKPENRRHSRTIGYDLKFLPAARDNRLHLVVALDWQNLPPLEAVVDISLTALNTSLEVGAHVFGRYPETSYTHLDLQPLYPELYGTTIYNLEYKEVRRDPESGFFLFEYYLDLPRPQTRMYGELMPQGYFLHLNPQIRWHGKGRFLLDYILLEDDLYRALAAEATPETLKGRMLRRIEQIDSLEGSEGLMYYYGMDEIGRAHV